MIVKKSDYELVYEIKQENKKENYVLLYKRYLPMIKKYSFNYSRKFYYLDSELYRDFIQELYFVMIEAINTIKFEKITDKETWKLNSRLFFFFKNMRKDKYKKIIKNIHKELSDNHNYSYNENFSEQYNEILNHIEINANDKQKKIVKYILDGYKICDIKKNAKISSVYYQLESLKNSIKKQLKYTAI